MNPGLIQKSGVYVLQSCIISEFHVIVILRPYDGMREKVTFHDSNSLSDPE